MLTVAVALAVAAGCGPAAPTVKAPAKKPPVEVLPAASAPAILASGSPVPTVPPKPVVSVTPTPVATLIGNNGSQLTGIVRVPLVLAGGSIVSDQGGAIISDSGGSLVGNNSGSYHLAALPDDQPGAGLTVHLLDGAGQPIQQDGKALIATTDAQGRYAFPVAASASNGLVQVDLPQGRGTLAAIVPKAAQQADVDLVSSLTSGYIFDQYVRTQPDRQVTLDKLPPDVEADTRAKAKAALSSGAVSVPDALSPRRVVETVNSLRQANPTFNAQMETVKKLLIAAGQSDLGNGHPGTEVALSCVHDLALALDGSLYINCSFDRRVWRLDPGGILATAAGNGKFQVAGVGFDPGGLEKVDGVKGPDASLIAVHGVALDSLQRPIFLEYPEDIISVVNTPDAAVDTGGLARVLRLERDGTLTVLWGASQTGKAAVAGTDGVVLVVTSGLGPEPAKVTAIKPDKAREVRHTFTDAETQLLKRTEAYGRDPQGRIYLGLREAPGLPAQVHRYDPATQQLTKLADQAADGLKGLALDANGTIFSLDGAGKLLARRPDGPAITVLAALPAGFALTMYCGVALAPDDSAYVRVGTTQVYQAKGGALLPVAGTPGNAAGADVALQEPHGVAVAADGSYYVADLGKHEVLKFTPDGKGSVFAGTGTAGYGGENVAAANAPLSSPHAVRLDAQGNLYVVERTPELPGQDLLDALGDLKPLCTMLARSAYRVRKINPAGQASTVYSSGKQAICDLAVAPDGTLYVAQDDPCAQAASVVAQAPGGQPTTLATYGTANALCVGPAGELYIAADNALRKYAGGPITQLPAAGWLPATPYYGGTMACDAAGKLYLATRIGNTILRYSPGTNTYENMAGDGALNFAGSTVDDSVKDARYPTFGPDGTLYFSDTGHKQVKRLPAAKLLMGVPQ